jgi:NAD(P)H-hydrate epimerase
MNIKKRGLFNHKGEHGKVLVIGGSNKYSGAPGLSALASLEMGTDLVIVYSPKSVASVIRSFSPSLIVNEGKGDNINPDDITDLTELLNWADTCVLGPGIGNADETVKAVGLILEILAKSKKSVVIDADAIKICTNYKEILKQTKAIVTPHAGEFQILTNTKLPDQTMFKERAKILELVSLNYGVTFLVKGKYDYISNADQTRVNKTGVPEMAVGGTGDILTGILASFLAWGLDNFDAACSAAYLCGKLGEEYLKIKTVKKKLDIKTFKSSDLIKTIPLIIGKYL